jgi:L-iditol 2-dehydrogenase
MEPLACCVRNIRRAQLSPNDSAVVVGMGSIGLMMVQLLKLIPARVFALDLKADRLELAKRLGADQVFLGNKPGFSEALMKETEGRGADIVIFTAGGGRTFQEALHWVRDGGTLNLFASLSDEPVPVSLDVLYHREITLFSSYSPSPEDLAASHRLLCDGKIKVGPLVTHHLNLAELQKGIDLMVSQQALKVVVNP